MKREEYKKVYRGFEVFPFKGKGIVKRLDGLQEVIDKKGYRTIRDRQNRKRMVSQIIFGALGIGYPYQFPISYVQMKRFYISFKDGDHTNCHYDNLRWQYKKWYVNKINHDAEVARYI